tara:strand:+ start:3712 stop:4035 length:324 start_codon:yes stop_codon:yes gene_type:complete
MIANAVIGERGLVALFKTSQEHSQLRQAIETLHDENRQLNEYVEALTAEPRLLENEARQELGMIKAGEQVFLIQTISETPVQPPQENLARTSGFPPQTRTDRETMGQ